MLINFKAKNFKTFHEGFTFDMKASRIRDLSYSVKSNLTDKRILTSSLIYGPNASGKTTIIEAMHFLKNLILDGTIENVPVRDLLLSAKKELVPFAYSNRIEPIEFEVEFLYDNIIFDYELSFYLGSFDDDKADRNIKTEILKINDKLIFERYENSIDVHFENIDNSFLINGLNVNLMSNDFKAIFNYNLDNKKLFLCAQFSTMISSILYDKFKEWLQTNFIVLSNFSKTQFGWNLNDSSYMKVPNFAYDAVSKIGVLGTELRFINKGDGKSELNSIFKDSKGKEHIVQSKLIESLGTLRFLDLFPLILDSIINGTTLVVDELDSSLHPMVIMSIANIYHDPDINYKHAQLIFSTHDAVLLNNKVFRRDEMCFVERNRSTKNSELYKLSDFLTNSNTPTRNTTDYINNYFKNKYGAIEFVDISPVFEEIINYVKKEEKKDEEVTK